MTSLLSLPPSELDTNQLPTAEAEDPGAPVRARPRRVSAALPGRDPLDLYYADIGRRQTLTREGEVAIGRRIEAAERGILEAWIGCPRALHDLALTAIDVRTGLLRIEDLLVEPDGRDPALAATRATRLTKLLECLLAMASSPATAAKGVVAELVTGLAELPLDRALGERIERSLRSEAAAGSDADREAVEATLATIARARRAIAVAKGELIEANLRLAVAIARQFRRPDVPLVDLAQEGNLGLMRAVDRFDYRRGYRFSTYAAWWIKQSIRYATLRQGKGLRVPAHLARVRSRIAGVRRELIELHGRVPSTEEIAERANVPLEQVRMIAELSLEPLSLDAPIGEDGDATLGEHIAGSEPPADETLARRRLMEQARELVGSLSEREREIVERRYGLHNGQDETLEEIGRSCALTRERIRQIEAQALEKLRVRSRKQVGSSYPRD